MAVVTENQGGDIEATKKPQRSRVASSRARAAAEKTAAPTATAAAATAKEPKQKKVPTVRKERKNVKKNAAVFDQPAPPAGAVSTGRVYPYAGEGSDGGGNSSGSGGGGSDGSDAEQQQQQRQQPNTTTTTTNAFDYSSMDVSSLEMMAGYHQLSLSTQQQLQMQQQELLQMQRECEGHGNGGGGFVEGGGVFGNGGGANGEGCGLASIHLSSPETGEGTCQSTNFDRSVFFASSLTCSRT